MFHTIGTSRASQLCGSRIAAIARPKTCLKYISSQPIFIPRRLLNNCSYDSLRTTNKVNCGFDKNNNLKNNDIQRWDWSNNIRRDVTIGTYSIRLYSQKANDKPTTTPNTTHDEPTTQNDDNDNENKNKPTQPKKTRANLFTLLNKLRDNIKWVLIRSNRRFNTDDFSAFISWIITGNMFLLILGTTTFFSLLLYTVNTVFAKEWVAFQIGYLITRNSYNLKVNFKEAILPDWGSGKITFKNCLISLRPKSPLDDGNYTQYDLSIQEINVKLSFKRWIAGKGIIEECEMSGIRGEIDRTTVVWAEGDSAVNWKNKKKFGDWEFKSFKVNDCKLFMKAPYDFRIVEICIFSMKLNRFRKNWMFYDLLNSDYVNGSYDGSLFTVNNRGNSPDNKRHLTRLRCDNLNIDHLNTGISGPFGWITQGSVDMIGDVSVPIIEDEFNPDIPMADQFIMDYYIRLNNPKATIPLLTNEISYINNALIRPIIGYINSRKTYIPIRYTVTKPLVDFDGSWTIYDCLLADDLQEEFYNKFVEYVQDDNENKLRLRRIGFWSLQFLLQFVLYFLSGYPV